MKCKRAANIFPEISRYSSESLPNRDIARVDHGYSNTNYSMPYHTATSATWSNYHVIFSMTRGYRGPLSECWVVVSIQANMFKLKTMFSSVPSKFAYFCASLCRLR